MAHSEPAPDTDTPDDCPACNHSPFFKKCFHCGWPSDQRVDGPRGLETVPQPTVPKARDLFENGDWTVDEDSIRQEPAVVDELRSVDTEAVEPLADAGYHDPMVGISCTKVSAFKTKRTHVTDTRLYDYLLLDAAVATAYFWTAFHGHESLNEFVDSVLEDNAHQSSEENIARTYRWLTEEIDAPTELADHQAGLGRWS